MSMSPTRDGPFKTSSLEDEQLKRLGGAWEPEGQGPAQIRKGGKRGLQTLPPGCCPEVTRISAREHCSVPCTSEYDQLVSRFQSSITMSSTQTDCLEKASFSQSVSICCMLALGQQ